MNSNEKVLRSKFQNDFEINSSQIQKLTIDYEKQIKILREEIFNVSINSQMKNYLIW